MCKKKSATVLVVDDDPVILDLVKEQISEYGYEPILASNGKEAMEAANKKNRIDLLLTDIMMPGINGIDLARQFLTLYPETRVLFMSGFMCPSLAHFIPDTERAFLQKPFQIHNLIAKMRSILSGPVVQPGLLS
ncbi:response regulator [Thermodesulfobacteriota bacterium]